MITKEEQCSTTKIFEEINNLNDEEIELFDKVCYNEDIPDKRYPVCLNEHHDGEILVSLRCLCKKERLCQICAFMVMKEKSQCPFCGAYVQLMRVLFSYRLVVVYFFICTKCYDFCSVLFRSSLSNRKVIKFFNSFYQ